MRKLQRRKADELFTIYSNRIVAWHSERPRRFRVRIESTTINTVVQEIIVCATSKAKAMMVTDIRNLESPQIIDIEFLSDTVKSTIDEKFIGVRED